MKTNYTCRKCVSRFLINTCDIQQLIMKFKIIKKLISKLYKCHLKSSSSTCCVNAIPLGTCEKA